MQHNGQSISYTNLSWKKACAHMESKTCLSTIFQVVCELLSACNRYLVFLATPSKNQLAGYTGSEPDLLFRIKNGCSCVSADIDPRSILLVWKKLLKGEKGQTCVDTAARHKQSEACCKLSIITLSTVWKKLCFSNIWSAPRYSMWKVHSQSLQKRK